MYATWGTEAEYQTSIDTYMSEFLADETNCETYGLIDDLSAYTYTDVYAVYDFVQMEEIEKGYVFVLQDDTMVGILYINGSVKYYDQYYAVGGSFGEDYDFLEGLVSDDNPFLFGYTTSVYCVNGLQRNMIYVDGITYDLDEMIVLGGDPTTLEYEYVGDDPALIADGSYVGLSTSTTVNVDMTEYLYIDSLIGGYANSYALTSITLSNPFINYQFENGTATPCEGSHIYLVFSDGQIIGSLSVSIEDDGEYLSTFSDYSKNVPSVLQEFYDNETPIAFGLADATIPPPFKKSSFIYDGESFYKYISSYDILDDTPIENADEILQVIDSDYITYESGSIMIEGINMDDYYAAANTVTTTTNTVVLDSTLCGDANLDGAVNLSDVIFLNRVTTGLVLINDMAVDNADVNADGSIDTTDALILFEFLIHVIAELPYTG